MIKAINCQNQFRFDFIEEKLLYLKMQKNCQLIIYCLIFFIIIL